MSQALAFLAWQRSGIYELADTPSEPVPRLQANVQLQLQERDVDGYGNPVQDTVPFKIMGPADARGLQRNAIRRMMPPPHEDDAEATKCVHVELAAVDLPWRYTPELAAGRELRPWIVLVVGMAEEVELLPDNQVRLSPAVTAAHPLDEAANWAHIQIELDVTQDVDDLEAGQVQALIDSNGGVPVARLLSPRRLGPNREYIAAIVPAFTPEGTDAWAPDTEVIVPVYHSWQFRTGEAGDFRTLAARLRAKPAEAEAGGASLQYTRIDPPADLMVRGAIAPVGTSDDPLDSNIANDMAALITPLVDERNRPVIVPPVYGKSWHADPVSPANQWGTAVNHDPRNRGVAGLGASAGVSLQDIIVKAVAEQVGPIDIADQRIRHLRMGMKAAGALWNRRLPVHPMRRLQLYGPSMRRIATPNGSVLDRISGPGRPLSPSLFSSAARRLLRRGPARTELAIPGAAEPEAILPIANQCPEEPSRTAPGLPSCEGFVEHTNPTLPTLEDLASGGATPSDFILKALGDLVQDAKYHMVKGAVEYIVDECTAHTAGLPYDFLVNLLELLADPIRNQHEITQQAELLAGVLLELPYPQPGVEDPLPSDRPCQPVDLDHVEEILTREIDPRPPEDPDKPNPWIEERVLSTLEGLEERDSAPPEICTSVDLPAWRFLRDMAPDWLLPGVGQLEADSVTAFESNPKFVAAFMLGLNAQTLAELRWRNLPIHSGCTPLRVFWGRSSADGSSRVDDIRDISHWTSDAELGSGTNPPGEAGESHLVLVFRSDLFRRYPDTMVSAIEAELTDGEPDFSEDAEPSGSEQRLWPIFQGRIGEEVTFFGFPLTPAEARRYWLVVEEAPSGYRFRSDSTDSAGDGADFAKKRLDDPVRVVIRGDYMIPESTT